MKTATLISLLATALLTGCSLFPTEAGDELENFDRTAPAVGAALPDLELSDLDGNPVQLARLAAGRPVVLMLGSHSCPVYRYRQRDLNRLKREFGQRVRFVTLYTQEAHPQGTNSPYRDEEWLTGINRVTGVRLDQPTTLADRVERARYSTQALNSDSQVLVDAMDNAAWEALGAAPAPAYVLDGSGRIHLRQVWFEPDGIKRALTELLQNGR